MTSSLPFRSNARHPLALALALGLVTLAGCSTPTQPLPGPLDYPRTPRPTGTDPGPTRQRPLETSITAMPSVPESARQAPVNRTAAPTSSISPGGDELSMAIEQTPLPMFIQILYGNVLKKAYSIDPAISARTDMVTFKTSRPVTRATMETLAFNLMRSYGISVQDYDGLVRIVPDTATGGIAPELRRGRALPETPEPLRPIFQYVELDIVRSTEISQWLKQILGTRINLQEDAQRNGFLLSGTQSDIRMAISLIESLDQPRMRGKVARRIAPAFMSATEMSNRLTDVLTAQGYAVSTQASSGTTPILVIPIAAIGSVVVFANTDAVMEQVIKWARELDRPPSAQTSNGIYTYAVKYADAQELARTLGEILGGAGGGGAAPAPAQQQAGSGSAFGTAAGQQTSTPAARTSFSGGRVVVNAATNTLIIRGSSADEYTQIITLLRELDRPTKSAMIEVVIAELARGKTLDLGVDWTFSKSPNNVLNSYSGTLGTAGLNLTLTNTANTILANINALAFANQARILSNPKIVARNGESATIQVGEEVPIITSQQSTGTGGLFGGNGIIQSVQYRSTGVILRVRPVINSGNRLDLDVSQEVSAAATTRTGVSSSPTISTRRIETKLSLRDGSTVLLGGLIDRKGSDSNSGVPFLRDIPGLGLLFSGTSNTTSETELLIMITPYVINDDYEAEGITEAIQKSFGDWAQTIKPSRVVTRPDAVVDSAPAASDNPTSQMLTPPAPRSSTTAPTSPTAAPAPSAVPADANSGVTMKIEAAPSSPTAPSTNVPPSGNRPAPTPTQTPPARVEQVPGAPLPGRVVDDPKIKEEIEKLLQKR